MTDAAPIDTTSQAPPQPRPLPPVTTIRWAMRGGMLLVALVALGMSVAGHPSQSVPAPLSPGGSVLVINLAQGPRYGETIVTLAGQEKTPLADAGALSEALTKALAGGGKSSILIVAEHGVLYSELERIRRAAAAAAPAKAGLRVEWALAR